MAVSYYVICVMGRGDASIRCQEAVKLVRIADDGIGQQLLQITVQILSSPLDEFLVKIAHVEESFLGKPNVQARAFVSKHVVQRMQSLW